MRFIVGIDIGGTFTDASAIELDSGREYTAKTPTTPDDLIEGLLTAIDLLAERVDLNAASYLASAVKFAHGTTQTSNVVFTWEGARTGLITTQGFGDELLIMRARGRVAGLSLTERRHLRATRKPPKIVTRDRIKEVPERVDAYGDVLVPLDEDAVRLAVRELVDDGVTAIAVSLLWSIKNSDHEFAVQRIIAEVAPEIHVTLAHQLAPVWGEYERAATAVVNAFVAPTLERYLDQLVEGLQDRQLDVPLLVLQANGGVVQANRVVPIHTIESGPAAGMVAARAAAAATGHRNIIATDVGGTTFKVGLITDGNWTVSRTAVINQYELVLPMVDLVSIGAGGGSIAWTDRQRLRIGPRSAGADPGPACYGWGGTEPTVTDADLVLGFLDPKAFLGGRLALRRDLAEEAMRPIAEQLFDGDVVAAAAGIRTIVDAQMGDLVRKATIERGHDPRRFTLFAYGGAGPLHAAGYARGLEIDQIIVPIAATVYSAYGAAASDIHHTLQRSVEAGLLEDEPTLEQLYRELEAEARALLDLQGVATSEQSLTRWADMRYERQLHDVNVAAPADASGAITTTLREAFATCYAGLYGRIALLDAATPELLRIGVEATGAITKPALPRNEPTSDPVTHAHRGSRQVVWPEVGAALETAVFDGVALRTGHRFNGPALVQQPGTTVAVPPGASVEVDPYANLVISLEEAT